MLIRLSNIAENFIHIIWTFWQQPINLDFNTNKSFNSGAIDIDIKYWFFNNKKIGLDSYSFNFGFICKTKGFLAEEIIHDEHFGIRIGTSIKL